MEKDAQIFDNPVEVINKRRLSDRERRFIYEYLIDLDPKKASLRAGFGPDTGEKLLQDVFLQKAVANALEMRAARAELQADWVLQKLKGTYEEAVTFRAKGMQPRIKVLELLMRHLGMLNDKLTVHKEEDVRALTDAELLRIASRARNVTPEEGEGQSYRLHNLHSPGISDSPPSQVDSDKTGGCSTGGDQTIDVDATPAPR